MSKAEDINKALRLLDESGMVRRVGIQSSVDTRALKHAMRGYEEFLWHEMEEKLMAALLRAKLVRRSVEAGIDLSGSKIFSLSGDFLLLPQHA